MLIDCELDTLADMGWSSPSVLGRYALVAACSGLVGWLLAFGLSSSVPVPGPSPEDRSTEWDRMHLRLDALQQQMEAVLAERSPQSVATVERHAVPEADPTHERIETILSRLERLAAALSSGTANAPLPRSPVNWGALDALYTLSERDEKAAKRSTLLLTPSEVVARFGFPSEAGGDGGGTWWNYLRIGPDGKQTGRVSFYFHGWRVTFHEIRLSAR